MQGSMTSIWAIIRSAGLLLGVLLALAAALPLSAHAGPLLSGYGGPGQGNQAILGSTLLGPAGGGSPGAGGPSGPSAPALSSRGAAGSSARRAPRAARSPSGSRAAHALLVEPAARAYPAVERESAATDSLGLSGTDIFLIALAAALLVFTAALTRAMASTRTAKGH
jgi:hypothetical protein